MKLDENLVFDKFISLGCQCTTAKSMKQCGFREVSGSFD